MPRTILTNATSVSATAAMIIALSAVSISAAGALPAPICNDRGKVLSAKAHKIHIAWLPTSWSSSFINGPASISKTVSITSQVTATVSASFELDESFIFASAKETYGLSLAGSRSHTDQVTYTLTVTRGKTEKMQEFHEGYELGITQKYINNNCVKATETSKTGNFFPVRSRADDTYCYARTPEHHAKIEVRYNCRAEPKGAAQPR